MTTREYFRKLRAESFAEDRETCLDVWEIAQHIGDGHNLPRWALLSFDGNPFVRMFEPTVYAQWQLHPQRAENNYRYLLLRLRAASQGDLAHDPADARWKGLLD